MKFKIILIQKGGEDMQDFEKALEKSLKKRTLAVMKIKATCLKLSANTLNSLKS